MKLSSVLMWVGVGMAGLQQFGGGLSGVLGGFFFSDGSGGLDGSLAQIACAVAARGVCEHFSGVGKMGY
jgi:hypothetical protein